MRLINDVKDKFTIIPNYILQQRNISLKAIGLYSKLSSFPDNWNFTESGLCSLVKDGQDSVRTAIKELEELGLFLRFRKRNQDGTLGETIFYISPIPMTEYKKNEIKSRFELEETLVQPVVEKPILDTSILENQTLYNNNIYNNNEYKTNNNIAKAFKKPTVEEIKNYCLERKNNVDAQTFYDFYESKGWLIGKNKMKDWKACVRTWEKTDKKNNKPSERRYNNVNW